MTFDPLAKLTVIRPRPYAFDLEPENEKDLKDEIEAVTRILNEEGNLIPEAVTILEGIRNDRVFWQLVTVFEGHDAFIVKSPKQQACVFRRDEIGLDHEASQFDMFLKQGKIPFAIIIEHVFRELPDCISLYTPVSRFYIVYYSDEKRWKRTEFRKHST